jgi:hypothetical protein
VNRVNFQLSSRKKRLGVRVRVKDVDAHRF